MSIQEYRLTWVLVGFLKFRRHFLGPMTDGNSSIVASIHCLFTVCLYLCVAHKLNRLTYRKSYRSMGPMDISIVPFNCFHPLEVLCHFSFAHGETLALVNVLAQAMAINESMWRMIPGFLNNLMRFSKSF